MVFIEITHFHPSRNSGYDNYYRNRPFKILKYIMIYPLYLAFLKLLTGGFSPMEI